MDLQQEDQAGTAEAHDTDAGNALRLVNLYGRGIRSCPGLGWLEWVGTHWQPDETGNIIQYAKKTIRAIYHEAGECEDLERRKNLANWAKKSEAAPRLHAMVDLARSEPMVVVKSQALDVHPMLLATPSGTVDLKTGQLRPANPDDLLTKAIPTPFKPGATAPRWEQFMREIFAGDESLYHFMQRLLGYSITGQTSEQVLPVLHGGGSNGKSVLMNTIKHVLGTEFVMHASGGLLLKQQFQGHPTSLERLRGKRIVISAEIDQGRALDEPLVKRLTGEDAITARRMRQDEIEFEPTHKLMLVTNHRPRIEGTDEAIWRRVLLIPFTVSFQGDRQDHQLSEKLRGEAPGILRYLVEGCLKWQEHGLDPPAAVRAATSSYRQDSDVVSLPLSRTRTE